jgi:hypothetical protein
MRVVGAALVAAVSLALVGPGSAAATPGPWTFGYTGGPQSFVVPAEVTELSMIVVGGAGGSSGDSLGGGPGGVSGLTYARFPVTPGEELTIWVGQEGQFEQVAWGWGCGATGGEGEGLTSENGGGGGGSSAVTKGGTSVPAGECFEGRDESAVLALGGGGGGGGASNFIPPPNEGISLGGTGGDGGNPAGTGGEGGRIAPGGCGGCEPLPHGAGGADGQPNGGGAGGGGGGFRGGAGGAVEFTDGGGGGGGGSSYVGPGADQSAYLAGFGVGNGSVTLNALGTELFQCTESRQTTTVPAGAGSVEIESDGGHGGSRGPGLGGAGGAGGTANSTFTVNPGQSIAVDVGCQGTRSPGWGYGDGGPNGQTPAPFALDGASGGGSSGVLISGQLVTLAGGGGGGGGYGQTFGQNENGSGGAGGAGGDGGVPAEAGAEGEPKEDAGGSGGAAVAIEGSEGGAGGNAAHDSLGGGGGGGGAGWFSGEGGGAGSLAFNLTGGGGGGGGGGTSEAAVGGTDFSFGTSDRGGDGLVQLTYLPSPPAAIVAYGGSKQQTVIGTTFAAPLAALVTNVSGRPVSGASVTFTLPSSGASATFSGGATTETVSTGANGVAISSPLTANTIGGAWEATASVSPVPTPASFALGNIATPTITQVTASDDPATPTEPVTFTAKVTAATQGAGTPTGVVQFKVDGTNLGAPVELVGDEATSIPDTGLTPGKHEIEAGYEGAPPSYFASAGELELPVEKTATATEVSSSLNPALPGESMTFTATIGVPSGNDPYDGSVQFFVDGAALGAPQPATNGTATSPAFSTSTVGKHRVVAAALETGDYDGSEGETIEVVDPDGVAVNVGSSANPAEYGQALQLEATVVPRPPVTLTPTGTVTFTVGATGCSGTLSTASTSCEPAGVLAPGEHEVDAHYSGDAEYEPGDGAMVEKIVRAHTHTTLGGSHGPDSVYGEPVTFDAVVGRVNPGSGTPTGSVQFSLDGQAVGEPATLEGGEASAGPVTPNAGPHVLASAYGGDADFAGDTGTAPYRVLAAPTNIALSATPEPSQPDEPVSFAADVRVGLLGGSSTPPVPTGAVQFRVEGLDFGTPVPLSAGRAVSPPFEEFEPGHHDVEAIYLPANENFEQSESRLDHEVKQPTYTALLSSENPSPDGGAVKVTAHVGPVTPVGSVGFQVDGKAAPGCEAISIAEEDASCTLSGLAPGPHEVRAAYSGAPLYDPSQATLVQTVGPPPPCKVRDVRGRLLLFRSRDAVRIVARYRAAAPGDVVVRFFARGPHGTRGHLLGKLEHTFSKPGRERVTQNLPAATMRRLRRSSGFLVSFAVREAPGYCARVFGEDLGIRRRVSGQQVWFQTNSNRSKLPADSR